MKACSVSERSALTPPGGEAPPPPQPSVKVFDPMDLLRMPNGERPLRDWQKMPMHMSIIGRNGSGKSYLVKHMLNQMEQVFGTGAIFWVCPRYSWDSNARLLSDTVDPRCVIFADELDKPLPELFADILATAHEHKRHGMSTLVVVDDLLSDIQSGAVGDAFKDMFIAGRHSHLTVWVLGQAPLTSRQSIG